MLKVISDFGIFQSSWFPTNCIFRPHLDTTALSWHAFSSPQLTEGACTPSSHELDLSFLSTGPFLLPTLAMRHLGAEIRPKGKPQGYCIGALMLDICPSYHKGLGRADEKPHLTLRYRKANPTSRG